jgi:uroporphyrinogen-III synthase
VTTGLAGARILVTRPATQAENLCQLIENQAGYATRFPTLEIEAVAPAHATLHTALSADWLIFTSKNAVDFALHAFNGKMTPLTQPAIAAVGGSTAARLRDSGLTVACVPAFEFNSEGLLAEAMMHDVAGKTCVIVRGVGGREKLAETLRIRGAKVEYLDVYRRLLPSKDSGELIDHLQQNQLDAVIVTSDEALHNLWTMMEPDSAARLRRLPLVVVSERIRQTAERLKFEQIVVSQQPTDAAILETLKTLFNGENSGRSN